MRLTGEEILGYSVFNSGGAEEVPRFERRLVSEICSFLSAKKRFIVAVDGLRRVGKTVVLKQVLHKLQKAGRGVFYFSFDKKAHQNHEVLEQVIEFFLKRDASAAVCLDEVGRIEDWAGVLKKHYDSSKATFLVSSSAALRVRKGFESLAGRMLNYTLPPLGFDEYLELAGAKKKELLLNLFEPRTQTFFREHLDAFLARGAYPELRGVEDAEAVRNYVSNSTVEKMIFDDIPGVFKISNVSKLLETYSYCANYSSCFIHENSIANAAGLSEPTASDYLRYLEESHLIQRVYTQGNYEKTIRKKKKVFVAAPALYQNTATSPERGKLVETAVFDKLRSLKPLTFLDAQKHEIDFLLRGRASTLLPIEVKSSQKISLQDLQSLSYYAKKKRLSQALVVYDGPYDEITAGSATFYLLPLSTFLASSLKM